MRDVVERLSAVPGREDRLTHLEVLPAAGGGRGSWPTWVPDDVRAAFEAEACAPPGSTRSRPRRRRTPAGTW
jgi:DEAD/DEAH box helicase domain-containing protein